MHKYLLTGAAALAIAVPAMAQVAATPGTTMAPMMRSGPANMMGHARLVAPLTRAQAEARAREVFRAADVNHDGVVTREEVAAGRQAMRTQLRAEMFETIDADHNGAISRDEFTTSRAGAMAGTKHRGSALAGESTQDNMGVRPGKGMRGMNAMRGAMLMRADANHDGKLTEAEAVAGTDTVFDRADANHDGTVTPEERQAAMATMMQAMRSRRAN